MSMSDAHENVKVMVYERPTDHVLRTHEGKIVIPGGRFCVATQWLVVCN